MRKFYFLVVIFVAFFSLRAVSQTVVGADYADNYSVWANTNNLGTGFGPWNLSVPNQGGFFLGNSVAQGFGDVNTGGKAFSMWGNPYNPNGGNYANAKRDVSDWASGYSFEIDLAIANRNGNKGIDIYAAGEEVPIFIFNVESDQYKVEGEDLGWGWIDEKSIFHLKVLQFGNHLKITLTRGSDSYSTVIANKEFSGFKVFVGDTEGGDLNNIHFNNLVIKKSSTLLFDDFNRSNSNAVGQPSSGVSGNWIETENLTANPNNAPFHTDEYIIINDNNQLEMRNCVNGHGHTGNKSAAFDMTGLYATTFQEANETMEWYFNMRQSQTKPGGFGNGSYGMAYVLGADNPDFGSDMVSGYAVVLGESGTDDPMRLIYFTTGLPGDPKATIHLPLTIASVPLTGPRNKYYSIKVTFDPCTREWTLHVRDNGTGGFTDPTTGTFDNTDSGTDATLIDIELKYMGAFYNHSYGCSNNPSAVFDDIYIPTAQPLAPAAYSWVGADLADYQVSMNWNPERECPRQTDRILFGNLGTIEVRNLPVTETIGQLVIENSQITLRDAANDSNPSILSIKGGTGVDFSIDALSTLFLNAATSNHGNDAVEISLLTGTTGLIDGSLVFQNTNSGNDGRKHRLIATDPNAVQVNGNVTALNLSSYPFGATGSIPNIEFNSGSVYNYYSGGSPFGSGNAYTKVVFKSGSKYIHHTTNLPSLIGRTYADFELNTSGILNVTGGISPWTVDSIIITNGHFNLSPNTYNIDINCKGNIHVLANQSFTINPTNHSTLSFTGAETQRIHGDGTLTFGDNVSIKVDNSAANGVGLILEKDISLNQNFTVENGKVRSNGKILTMTGTNSTILVNDTIEGTNVGSGNNLSLIASGARTNITGSALARFFNITVGANDTLAISTGLESMYGSFNVSENAKLMINAGGYIANTNPGASKSPNYSATSQLIYNTGNGASDYYGRYMEWTGIANPGYPGNVIVQNETHVSTNKGDEHTLPLGVQNNLLIRSGTLNIENNTSKVTIGGHVEIGDATTSGTLDLSFKMGGDLEVKGDFILNEDGTFNANQRAVIFSGLENQTITSKTASNDITFNYVQVAKPSGELLLEHTPGTTVNITGSSEVGGEALVLSGGDINLQGQTLNLGGAAEGLKLEGDGTVEHIIKSIPPAEFNIKGYKRVVSQDGTKLTFNEGVTVNIEAGMDFGPGVTTINATLQINPDGYADVNAPFYGPLGILKYNTGNVYWRRVEWDGTDGNAGYPNDVIVTGGTTLAAGGVEGQFIAEPFGARQDVTIEDDSKIYMDYNSYNMTVPLIVGRDLIIKGSLSASNVAPGDIYVGRNWERTSTGIFSPNDRQVLFNGSTAQTITAAGGEVFDYLGFANEGTKELLSDITVNKKIEFYSGTGPLSGDGKTIHLLGDWDNQHGQTAFAEAGTTVSFEGDIIQTINTVSTSENFHHLKMKNAVNGGVKLNKNASIYGNLEFITGLIDATTHQVDFQPGSSNSGSSLASYINGIVTKTGFTEDEEFKFPVGGQYTNDENVLVNVYQPAGLVPTSTSGTARFKVDYKHESYFPWAIDPNNLPPMQAPLEKVSTCNYWNINKEVAGTDARVRLYWNDACFDITAPDDLVVAKVDGGQWVSMGAATTTSDAPYSEGSVITTNALSSFSPFAIGSTSRLNVLPIELLSFSATPKGNVVETRWVTSTEINNEYFSVERSVDAVTFTKIGRVQGAGNSTGELSYSFTDDAPYSGVSYYRLKQTDFDGKATYSDIRSVRMDTDSRFELINVYRSEQGVNLAYRSDVEILHAEVFDLLGKRLFTTRIDNINGQSTIRPSLVRGIYLLRLSNGVEVVSSKFFY